MDMLSISGVVALHHITLCYIIIFAKKHVIFLKNYLNLENMWASVLFENFIRGTEKQAVVQEVFRG